jgi:hypothetical protein
MLRAVKEADFMEQLREEARLMGWLVYHTYNSQRSEAGFPDLALVRGARMLFIECKTMVGRVTDDQQHWVDAINAVQGRIEARVFRPSDWDEIHRILL